MRKIIFSIAMFGIAAMPLYGQTSEVREVRIVSEQLGVGKDEIVIVRTGSVYRGNSRDVSPSAVEALSLALREPAITDLDLSNIGITPQWLNDNAEPPPGHYLGFQLGRATTKQQQLYHASIRDLKIVEPIVRSFFGGNSLHDNPVLRVEVTERTGTKLVVSSTSGSPFMLPLTVERDGVKTETYNANISRAVAALIPSSFHNRSRLLGGDFRGNLIAAVHRSIKDKWEYLDVENRAGEALVELGRKFEVREAEIDALHAVDYGMKWVNGNSDEQNLRVVLNGEKFAPGFAIRLVLPFEKGKVDGLDVFATNVERYRELLFSVDWLKKEFRRDGTEIWLRYVRGRSFSQKAMQMFADDMRMLGRSELIPEVEKHQADIALISVGRGLEYYHSFWLVMPDRRVILWRYGIVPGLKWTANDFASKVCTDYHSGRVQCVGAVISPAGDLVQTTTSSSR